MQLSEEEIRKRRVERFKDAVKPVSTAKEKEEPKQDRPKPAPRIVYDAAMQQKKLIHETCTYVLGNGIRYPFSPNTTHINSENVNEYITLELRSSISDGTGEVSYLCRCFDRLCEKKRDLDSSNNSEVNDLLVLLSDFITGRIVVSVNNYYQPGFESSFISQFMPMFSAVNCSQVITNYILIDSRTGQLNQHLNAIFTHLRNTAISAVVAKDSALLCNCLMELHLLLSVEEGCVAFGETQVLITAVTEPEKTLFLFKSDYLAPFFDYHPTEFIGGRRVVQPDISTPQALGSMRSQFVALMDDMKIMNDWQTAVMKQLLKNPATKSKIRQWIHAIIVGGDEYLKSNPNHSLAVSLNCLLNLQAVLYNFALPVMNKKKFPDPRYLFSTDPLILSYDRVDHNADRSQCTINPEELRFDTLCIWYYAEVFRRAFGGLQIMRDRVLRNLSHLLPRGYQDIPNVSPNNYREVEFLIYVELATGTYFGNQDSMMKWLNWSRYLSEYLMLLESDNFNGVPSINYTPIFLIEDILAVLTTFETISFPDSIFIPSEMYPILCLLVHCLSYDEHRIGSFLNVHMRADITKCIYSLYMPRQSRGGLLSRDILLASECLMSDATLVNELLHILVRQFSEVESVGLESTQYRKYIIVIMRYFWNDKRCSQTVIDMRNEPEMIQTFVQTLITSFSKLTDDAFAAIPQIKSLYDFMTQPEYASLTDREKDERQFRLTQLEQSVRFSFDLTTETLFLLLAAAKPWGDIWMSERTMKNLANSLPRLVQQLVGKEGRKLKIDNPDYYHFDPYNLLRLLVKTILVFSDNQQFIMCMNEEGTLNLGDLEKTEVICRHKALLDTSDQQKLHDFVSFVKDQQKQLEHLNEVLNEAPEEFFDEITGELMSDPVMLPNSKQVLDRTTIERMLLQTPQDPYDRTPLKKEELLPMDELKNRINEWKMANNYSM